MAFQVDASYDRAGQARLAGPVGEESSCKKRLRHETQDSLPPQRNLRRSDVRSARADSDGLSPCGPSPPHGPSTPDSAEAAHCAPVLGPAAWHLHTLRVAQEWAAMLTAAHPVLANSVPPEAPALAVALYRQHLRALVAEGRPRAVELLAAHDASTLAACLWAAVKFLGHRIVIPGASFMAAVTGVPHKLLLVQELRLMEVINWRICAVARECGALPRAPAAAPAPQPPARRAPCCCSGGGIPVRNVAPEPPLLSPAAQHCLQALPPREQAEGSSQEEDGRTDSWLAAHFGSA
eukprot:scaffold4.g4852.t1